MALSPDGKMLAFVSPDEQSGEPMIFVQRVGSPGATELSGSEGASYPFWSPDDAYVAFFARGKLYKTGVSGGTPQALASAARARGGSWGRKGVIAFAPDAGGPLWKVNPDGSDLRPLTQSIYRTEENSHRWPVFLPDGDHFLFWAGNFANAHDDASSGIYITSLAASGKQLLVLCHSNPGFALGHLFYLDDQRSLQAIPLDISQQKVAGGARVIVDQVGYQPSTYRAAFTVAEDGTVIYNTSSGATQSVLTWHDRTGKELGRIGEIGVLANPMLSPDGKRVTVDITDVKANNVDI
jgi:Tol biopolymer transport system component